MPGHDPYLDGLLGLRQRRSSIEDASQATRGINSRPCATCWVGRQASARSQMQRAYAARLSIGSRTISRRQRRHWRLGQHRALPFIFPISDCVIRGNRSPTPRRGPWEGQGAQGGGHGTISHCQDSQDRSRVRLPCIRELKAAISIAIRCMMSEMAAAQGRAPGSAGEFHERRPLTVSRCARMTAAVAPSMYIHVCFFRWIGISGLKTMAISTKKVVHIIAPGRGL